MKNRFKSQAHSICPVAEPSLLEQTVTQSLSWARSRWQAESQLPHDTKICSRRYKCRKPGWSDTLSWCRFRSRQRTPDVPATSFDLHTAEQRQLRLWEELGKGWERKTLLERLEAAEDSLRFCRSDEEPENWTVRRGFALKWKTRCLDHGKGMLSVKCRAGSLG